MKTLTVGVDFEEEEVFLVGLEEDFLDKEVFGSFTIIVFVFLTDRRRR